MDNLLKNLSISKVRWLLNVHCITAVELTLRNGTLCSLFPKSQFAYDNRLKNLRFLKVRLLLYLHCIITLELTLRNDAVCSLFPKSQFAYDNLLKNLKEYELEKIALESPVWV